MGTRPPGEEHRWGHGYGPHTQTKPRRPLTPRLTASRHPENPRAHTAPRAPTLGIPLPLQPCSATRGQTQELKPTGTLGRHPGVRRGFHSRDGTAPAGGGSPRSVRPGLVATAPGAQKASVIRTGRYTQAPGTRVTRYCATQPPRGHKHVHTCATQTARTPAALTHTHARGIVTQLPVSLRMCVKYTHTTHTPHSCELASTPSHMPASDRHIHNRRCASHVPTLTHVFTRTHARSPSGPPKHRHPRAWMR